MGTLYIRGLGAFDVAGEGGTQTALNTRAKLLLFYLILHRTAPQSRQHVAFVFFPDSSENQARANLRGLIRELRKALPEADQLVDSEGQNIQWRADAACLPDVVAFEDAVAQSEQARRAGQPGPERAALDSAAAAYEGELLPGRYEDWVLVERERLQEAFSDVLRRLALLCEAARDYRTAIGYAERWRRLDDLREEPYRLLMRLHAANGDRGAVARVWEQCAAKLRAGLDVEPSAETRRTFEQYRDFEPPAPPAQTGAADATNSAPPPRPAAAAATRTPPPPVDLPRAPDRRLRYAKDALNYGLPAAGLAVSVVWLHAQIVIALPLSVLAFLGLYFILNPRSANEEAQAAYRADVRAKLAECAAHALRIRALLPAIRKPAVRDQVGRIAGLAEGLIRKYAGDEQTPLAGANSLEFFLSLTVKILEWYVQHGMGPDDSGRPDDSGPGGSGRPDVRSIVERIEGEVLPGIESALNKLATRADQSGVAELEVAINLLNSVLKMEGLS